MKYVTLDYEEPGEPNNYWHIFSLDNEPEGMFDSPSIFTMVAPNNEKTKAAVIKVCEAIDAAIEATEMTSSKV